MFEGLREVNTKMIEEMYLSDKNVTNVINAEMKHAGAAVYDGKTWKVAINSNQEEKVSKIKSFFNSIGHSFNMKFSKEYKKKYNEAISNLIETYNNHFKEQMCAAKKANILMLAAEAKLKTMEKSTLPADLAIAESELSGGIEQRNQLDLRIQTNEAKIKEEEIQIAQTNEWVDDLKAYKKLNEEYISVHGAYDKKVSDKWWKFPKFPKQELDNILSQMSVLEEKRSLVRNRDTIARVAERIVKLEYVNIAREKELQSNRVEKGSLEKEIAEVDAQNLNKKNEVEGLRFQIEEKNALTARVIEQISDENWCNQQLKKPEEQLGDGLGLRQKVLSSSSNDQASSSPSSSTDEAPAQEVTETASIDNVEQNSAQEVDGKNSKEAMEKLAKSTNAAFKVVFEVLLDKFNKAFNEDVVESSNVVKDELTIKFKKPLRIWINSVNEEGVQEPRGGIVFMFGHNESKELKIKCQKNVIKFENGFSVFSRVPDSVSNKIKEAMGGDWITPSFKDMTLSTTKSEIHFRPDTDALFSKSLGMRLLMKLVPEKYTKRTKSIEEIKKNWGKGEVVQGNITSEQVIINHTQ